MLTELLPQNAILLSQILNDWQLSLIHLTGNGHEQEQERIERPRHLVPTNCPIPRHQVVTTSRFQQFEYSGHTGQTNVMQALRRKAFVPNRSS